MNSAVFLSLVHSIKTERKKKSLDRKYVLLRRADVKQECRRVSIMRKNNFSLFSRRLPLLVDYIYVDPLLNVIY